MGRESPDRTGAQRSEKQQGRTSARSGPEDKDADETHNAYSNLSSGT